MTPGPDIPPVLVRKIELRVFKTPQGPKVEELIDGRCVHVAYPQAFADEKDARATVERFAKEVATILAAAVNIAGYRPPVDVEWILLPPPPPGPEGPEEPVRVAAKLEEGGRPILRIIIHGRPFHAVRAWRIPIAEAEPESILRELFEEFSKLFECHPSEENTTAYVLELPGGAYDLVWVCSHFEETTSWQVARLASFMMRMKDVVGADYVNVVALDDNEEILLLEAGLIDPEVARKIIGGRKPWAVAQVDEIDRIGKEAGEHADREA